MLYNYWVLLTYMTKRRMYCHIYTDITTIYLLVTHTLKMGMYLFVHYLKNKEGTRRVGPQFTYNSNRCVGRGRRRLECLAECLSIKGGGVIIAIADSSLLISLFN